MKNLTILLSLATILATCVFPMSLHAEDPYTLDMLRLDREAAKWRDRGLIYNNDGGDMLGGATHTPEGLLDVRTNGIIGSQVDSLFYCVDTVGMVYYDSEVSEIFTTTDGRYYNNMTQDLLNQGTDALEVMVDFSRQNDIEVFCSLRMNDTHDASGDRLKYSFPEVKNNPGWIMGNDADYGAWSAFDFGVQGVRDLTLDIFTEICTNYDVDGIELDFLRHSFFFRSHASGGTATDADRELMTQLVRDIRTMTEQVGLDRGKPILVSVRVPDALGYSSDIGLDVTQWLEEDLFDMMTVSCHFRAEEWSESVALGHQYDVPVYAGMSESRITGETASLRNGSLAYYGRAAAAWEEGVDGIYMFNYFNDTSELWDVVGDPETLEGRNKVYLSSARGVSYMNQSLAGGVNYLDRVVVSPDHPLSLQTNQRSTVPLVVGDDLSGLTDTEARARLRLLVSTLPTTGGIFAFLGGTSLGTPTVNGNYLDFLVDPALIAQGTNSFEIVTNASPSEAIKINDFQLWVSFRPSGLATPILSEPFHVVPPGNVEQGDYTSGPLVRASATPGSDYFTTNWTSGQGAQTGRFELVADGLTHNGVDASPGAVRFTSDATVSGLQSVVREFKTDAYTTSETEFYMSGLASFDENFSTDAGSYAMTGLLNAEEGTPGILWTIGLQWGYVGNGNGGVDAVVRYRQAADWSVVTTVLEEDVTPGTHLFVMKVQAEKNGSIDYLNVWLDPADTWSEAEAGASTLSLTNAGCWLLPTGDPNRLVDTLVLGVNDIGVNTSVLFDEIRLGTDWYDLFLPLTEQTSIEPIPGDANGDGRVDGSDVTILAGNWQILSGATWAMGDFNADGRVDGSDVTILAGNWQAGVSTTATAVPEPSIWLMLLGFFGFLGARRFFA